MKRLLFLAVAIAFSSACGGPSAEGLDVARVPPDVRGDYAVFAQRCSKCHSLARPLESGIVDDLYWSWYVAKMRRMPGSGISRDDEARILRFLHWYAADRRANRATKEAP